MKRTITIFILLVTVLLGFSGCGSSDKSAGAKGETPKPKLKIVATIFPEYSWTKELLGSHEQIAVRNAQDIFCAGLIAVHVRAFFRQ